ncbi:MAG TPA: chemotaxis protein CheD [Armatimonadota bacterium]|nr:chemotaxis protein CheD [Armatimonadota bacterium]
MRKTISIGMGEMVVTSDPDAALICLGLGSCIAICAYDPRRNVGAMVHVVLPAPSTGNATPPAKYASTAVPLLVEKLTRAGVRKADARIILCGGAAIFAALSGIMDIGQRNIAAVHEGLQQAGLKVIKEDVGGKESRTVTLDVATGIVKLRTVRTGEAVFADLRA